MEIEVNFSIDENKLEEMLEKYRKLRITNLIPEKYNKNFSKYRWSPSKPLEEKTIPKPSKNAKNSKNEIPTDKDQEADFLNEYKEILLKYSNQIKDLLDVK